MIPITEHKVFAVRNQRFLRWTRNILLIIGILALTYVVFILISARIYQKNAVLALEKQIQAEEQHKAEQPVLTINEGDVLGRIDIPRIGVSVAVLQGTTSRTLRLGVGHINGTALPGEPGNIGIAGHRDTYFRALKDIRRDDEIQLETAAGITRYEVEWIQVTSPSDIGVLAPTTESSLTLVTCYPFYYIGAAPKRFIVHAHKQ
ncbi:MAG: class D sortase [Terracidiphilus sp.]|jgi:sortase A